jgi:hypothetical protein
MAVVVGVISYADAKDGIPSSPQFTVVIIIIIIIINCVVRTRSGGNR